MINPVLRREMKTSMRSWRTFLALMLYLVVMFAVVGIFIYVIQFDISSMGIELSDTVAFYIVLASFQLAFILFISPALTAGSISGERERQTLDTILLTKMSPLSIVIGKLMSSLSMVLLMIVMSMPIFAVVLNYGGVSILDILALFCYFIMVSAMTGSAGIFFSTLFKRTAVSTVISYIFLFFICGVNFIAFIAYAAYKSYLFYSSSMVVTVNPIIATLSLGSNPIISFIILIEKQLGYDVLRELFAELGYTVPNVWLGIASIFISIAITVSFLLLSARNIQPVKKKLFRKKQ